MTIYTERLDPPNSHTHAVLPNCDNPVSLQASGHGSIVAGYPNGISFIDQMGALDGYLTIIGGYGLILSFCFCYMDFAQTTFDYVTVIFLLLGIGCFFIVRSDSVGYHYQPVLFDRAAQKIHVFVDEGITIRKFWQLVPPSHIDTWDWACARAEIVEFVVLGGGGIPRPNYGLVCAITDQPGSSKVVARFGVGISAIYASDSMVQRWEHIRRFMNKDGPHLVPGDSLFLDESTINLWAALTFGQPLLGTGSRGYWTGEEFYGMWFLTIPAGLMFLILLPFSAAAGLMRWLSHAAKRAPAWPKDILASIGPELTIPELEEKLAEQLKRKKKLL